MTPEQEQSIRERHALPKVGTLCRCGQFMPCDTAVVLAALDEAGRKWLAMIAEQGQTIISLIDSETAALAREQALAEALRWPLAWPCRRENDSDCDAHGAEWPSGNDVCEWVLQGRAALREHEETTR